MKLRRFSGPGETGNTDPNSGEAQTEESSEEYPGACQADIDDDGDGDTDERRAYAYGGNGNNYKLEAKQATLASP